MAAWYREHLGIEARDGCADFTWRDKDHPDRVGRTVWAIFPTDSTHLGSAPTASMINYRVADLEKMLEQLRRAGVPIEKVEDHEYGRFAWLTDPEGHRIELWEPRET
jgi:predicted enzyme related to lactoylglutathione lyase